MRDYFFVRKVNPVLRIGTTVLEEKGTTIHKNSKVCIYAIWIYEDGNLLACNNV